MHRYTFPCGTVERVHSKEAKMCLDYLVKYEGYTKGNLVISDVYTKDTNEPVTTVWITYEGRLIIPTNVTNPISPTMLDLKDYFRCNRNTDSTSTPRVVVTFSRYIECYLFDTRGTHKDVLTMHKEKRIYFDDEHYETDEYVYSPEGQTINRYVLGELKEVEYKRNYGPGMVFAYY